MLFNIYWVSCLKFVYNNSNNNEPRSEMDSVNLFRSFLMNPSKSFYIKNHIGVPHMKQVYTEQPST